MKAGAQTQPNENESQILDQPLWLEKGACRCMLFRHVDSFSELHCFYFVEI